LYLHLGQNVMVKKSEITAIFDLDTSTVSPKTRDFLTNAKKAGKVIEIGGGLPRSFAVCTDRVYVSPISAQTLAKRAEAGGFKELE